MTEAWIGVIGALLGTLVGAGIAALVGLREQQRAPKLLLLEKRVDISGSIFVKLYAVAECIHRDEHGKMLDCINDFNKTLINNIFYLDKKSKLKLTAVQNYLMKSIDEKGIDPKRYVDLMNESVEALHKGIDMKYTPD